MQIYPVQQCAQFPLNYASTNFAISTASFWKSKAKDMNYANKLLQIWSKQMYAFWIKKNEERHKTWKNKVSCSVGCSTINCMMCVVFVPFIGSPKTLYVQVRLKYVFQKQTSTSAVLVGEERRLATLTGWDYSLMFFSHSFWFFSYNGGTLK